MGGVSSGATLKLPLRRLPDIPSDCAFCLADGPSCDEYDLSPVWQSGCHVIGYNRAWYQGRLDRYVALHDVCLKAFLQNCRYPAIVHSLEENRSVFDKFADASLHQFLPTASLFPVCVAYSLGYRKIFILGEDGYFSTRGRHRRYKYSRRIQMEDQIPAFKSFARGEHYELHTFGTKNRFGVAWNNTLSYKDAEIVTLSPYSWPALLYPLPEFVASQPFGRIDRSGEAVVIEIAPYSGDEISALTYHPCFVATPPQKHLEAIRNLRHMHPSLAIFLRTAWCFEFFQQGLESYDVVVGPVEAEVDPAGFDHLWTMRFPPVST